MGTFVWQWDTCAIVKLLGDKEKKYYTKDSSFALEFSTDMQSLKLAVGWTDWFSFSLTNLKYSSMHPAKRFKFSLLSSSYSQKG
jgi:hypothetical protein